MCVAGGRKSTSKVVAGGTAADRDEAISSRIVGRSRFPSEPSCSTLTSSLSRGLAGLGWAAKTATPAKQAAPGLSSSGLSIFTTRRWAGVQHLEEVLCRAAEDGDLREDGAPEPL